MRDEKGRFIKGSQIGKKTWFKKGEHSSRKTEFKKGRVLDSDIETRRINKLPRREEHYEWKGDRVGYDALHRWVYKELGRPLLCDLCGDNTSERMYHWANRSGLYRRDLSDWMRACVPCHKKYDLGRMAAI